MVTQAIKLSKYQTVFCHWGKKWTTPVGIGLQCKKSKNRGALIDNFRRPSILLLQNLFVFLVKIALFRESLLFSGVCVMHFLPDHVFDYGRKAWRESPKKRRDALKRAILTKKSKIFIKAKLTVSKSCLLGLLGFLIFWILRGDLL